MKLNIKNLAVHFEHSSHSTVLLFYLQMSVLSLSNIFANDSLKGYFAFSFHPPWGGINVPINVYPWRRLLAANDQPSTVPSLPQSASETDDHPSRLVPFLAQIVVARP